MLFPGTFCVTYASFGGGESHLYRCALTVLFLILYYSLILKLTFSMAIYIFAFMNYLLNEIPCPSNGMNAYMAIKKKKNQIKWHHIKQVYL